jgi:hypothetical protein
VEWSIALRPHYYRVTRRCNHINPSRVAAFRPGAISARSTPTIVARVAIRGQLASLVTISSTSTPDPSVVMIP